MTKTLAGNFSLLTFEDHPVVVTVSGIRNLTKNICDSTGRSQNRNLNVSDLYDQYKSSRKEST